MKICCEEEQLHEGNFRRIRNTVIVELIGIVIHWGGDKRESA